MPIAVIKHRPAKHERQGPNIPVLRGEKLRHQKILELQNKVAKLKGVAYLGDDQCSEILNAMESGQNTYIKCKVKQCQEYCLKDDRTWELDFWDCLEICFVRASERFPRISFEDFLKKIQTREGVEKYLMSEKND